MRIGVIVPSTQSSKSELIVNAVREAQPEAEVLNLGCFASDVEQYSYVEIALAIALLLHSKAADFVVTGCSSGQGMMLACNAMPGVLCGYIPTPQDAYLFGRINAGNAVSLPLGLGFGWAGELNLRYTLKALFDGPFGSGYPAEHAERKRRDTLLLKQLKEQSQKDMAGFLAAVDKELLAKIYRNKNVQKFLQLDK
ncbi:MAG: RpiB/LacA/LacB family sugar-phosphate isomerase [Phascolarctobacterium sp.]|nr:RpiB/LacA/LacB family sugar-phosphate isomerase [Phascolarctobacterium sp.]